SNGDLYGASAPYTVVPAAAASVGVVVTPSSLVAGSVVSATVQVTDAHGNPVDDVSPDGVSLVGANVDADCTHNGPPGALTWSCAVTTARPDAVLRASVLEPFVQGDSAPFEVVNGPLD